MKTIGKLLSNVFVKHWKAEFKDGEDDTKILEFALTWSPFMIYISNQGTRFVAIIGKKYVKSFLLSFR